MGLRYKGGNSYKSSYVLILILLIICIFGGIIFIKLAKPLNLFERFTNNSKTSIEYYYMEKCHFCESFNPMWEEFIKTKTDNYTTIKYDLNDNGKGQEKANKFKIHGTPTVVAVKNNELIDTLDGSKRTVKDLLEFAQKNSK